MLSFLISSIVWNVSPEIFSLKLWNTSVSFAWYGLLFVAGLVLGQQILVYIFRREGKPMRDVEAITVYLFIAIVIGARLGHFVFYEWQLLVTHPGKWLRILVTPPFQGLASHGAMICMLLALYLYTRKRPDQSFFWVLDRVVIAVAVGGMMIRLGNLFNSEIYGKPTSLPWGFLLVRETNPALLPVVPRHPTQLYESLFCLLLLVFTFVLWKYKRHQLAAGVITGLFLILLFSFRFLIEFLKNNQSDFEQNLTLNMGQILSIPAIVIGLVILWMAQNRKTAVREVPAG